MADVFPTVISGVVVYVVGQVALKLLIEPVQELKKTIGAISHALIERANVIYNPGAFNKEIANETSRELRKLAARLKSHLRLIPVYRRTAQLFWLPALADIQKAHKALIGLSNGVLETEPGFPQFNHKNINDLCESLHIDNPG